MASSIRTLVILPTLLLVSALYIVETWAQTPISSTMSATPSIQPETLEPNIVTVNIPVHGGIHCNPLPGAPESPLTASCLMIPLFEMSIDPATINFLPQAYGGSLPWIRRAGRCQIEIDFYGGPSVQHERYSWGALRAAASDIVHLCSLGNVSGSPRTAGAAILGEQGRLRMTVSRWGYGGSLNATGEAVD